MKLDPAIIAMDLDDTLLRHDLSISDRTVQTLERCAERGILPVLASGRSPEAMAPYARRIGLDVMPSYIIANNGSQILRSNTFDSIYERFIPTDIAIEAFRLCEDAGLSCHIYERDMMYVSKETEYSQQDFNLSGLKPVVPDDYEQIIRKGVYKLVIPGDPEYIVAVEAELKVLFEGRATIFVSKPYFMEILPIGAGKGEALKELAEDMLRIPSERVMAFGDSMNDESMLRYAPISVAMKNSRPEILRLARHVTERTNDEDGLAYFLEKHVLDGYT